MPAGKFCIDYDGNERLTCKVADKIITHMKNEWKYIPLQNWLEHIESPESNDEVELVVLDSVPHLEASKKSIMGKFFA